MSSVIIFVVVVIVCLYPARADFCLRRTCVYLHLLLLDRITRTQYVDAACCYRPIRKQTWSVGLSVSLSHLVSPAKNG